MFFFPVLKSYIEFKDNALIKIYMRKGPIGETL